MSQELAVFPIWVASPTSTAITNHQLIAIQEAISMKVRSTFMGRFALAKSQLVVRQPIAETDYRGANDAEVVAALVRRTPHSVWVAVCPDKSGKLTASIESASTPESPKIDIDVDNAATASTFQIYTSWTQLTSTHCGATNGDLEKKTIKDEDDVGHEETPSCMHLPALLFHKYLLLRRERQTSSDHQLLSIPCPFDEHHDVSFVGIAKDDDNEAAAARDLAVRTHLKQYHMEDCVAVVADFMLRRGLAPMTQNVEQHHSATAANRSSSSHRRRTQHKRPRESTSRSSSSNRSSSRSSSSSSSSSSSAASNRNHTHSQKSGASRVAPFGGAELTTVSGNSNVASSSFIATNAPSLVETFTANAVATGREQLPLPPVPDMTSIHFSAPAGIPLDCSLLLSTIAQEVGGSHHIRSYRHVHSKNCTFVDMSSPALAADCIARWWPHHSALVLNNGVRLRCNWAKNQPPPAPFSGGAGGGAASSNQQQHYQHNNIQATASLHSPSDHGVPDLQQQAGGAYFQPPPPPQHSQYAQQPVVEGSSYLPPQYSVAPPYAAAQHSNNNNHNNTPPVYLQQQQPQHQQHQQHQHQQHQQHQHQQHQQHQQQQQQPVKTPSSLAVLHLSPDIDVSERVAFLDLSRYGVVLNLKLFPEYGRGTVIFKDPLSTKALLHSISEAGGGWLRDVSDGFVI